MVEDDDDEWIQLTPTTEIPEHAEWKARTFETSQAGSPPRLGDRTMIFICHRSDGSLVHVRAPMSCVVVREIPLAHAPRPTQWGHTEDEPRMWRGYAKNVDIDPCIENWYLQFFFRPLCMNDYVMK